MSPWCDTSRKCRQLWNSQSPECGTTSPRNWQSTDITISVSPMFREFPYERSARQVQLAIPTEIRFRGHPRLWCSEYISDLAWSRLGVEPAELSKIAVDLEVFQVIMRPTGYLISPHVAHGACWVWDPALIGF